MENEITLCQSNVLTESRYNFSRIEKNCLYKIIEKVRHDYVEGSVEKDLFENMRVCIDSADLSQIADEDHTKQAKDAMRSLQRRTIDVEDKEGNWLLCGYINYAKRNAKTKTYEVEVSKEILPFLVELARNFTTYSLAVAMTLKGKYSQRFYELCCQYRNRIEKDGVAGFHKTQQQLREMFCLESKYSLNSEFNNRVIETARKELKDMYDQNQCDLYFDVNIKGRGKTMCYDFKIITREVSEKQKLVFEDIRSKWLHIQREMMAMFKKDSKFIDRTMRALDFNPNLINPVFDKLERVKRDFVGAERAKVLRFILKNDFDLN